MELCNFRAKLVKLAFASSEQARRSTRPRRLTHLGEVSFCCCSVGRNKGTLSLQWEEDCKSFAQCLVFVFVKHEQIIFGNCLLICHQWQGTRVKDRTRPQLSHSKGLVSLSNFTDQAKADWEDGFVTLEMAALMTHLSKIK